MRRSTIMDGNSFRADSGSSATDLAMIQRRERVLGPSYRLFYEDPVHLVKGEGARLWDAHGAEYLDMYNNVASVGHAHPRVVAAVTEQALQLNTHTRYLHEKVLDYAEQLTATMPDGLEQAMFVCTGSEANDLAVRMAQVHTGGTGVIVTEEAYHGNSALTSALSPALGSGNDLDGSVRVIPAPDAYRVDTDDLGAWFAARITEAIADLESSGHRFAAFIADSLFSSDGVFADPVPFLAPAIDAVRAAGGLFIADEVQPGFGRTGTSMWGFDRHGVVPDLVTLGKPMGNGMPVAAVVGTPEVFRSFADRVPYFNTFGGNPVSIAAAQAVLDIIQDDDLPGHNARVGAELIGELNTLAASHPGIGDVRGSGLYLGIELVHDTDDLARPDGPRALAVINALRRHHILTSVAGPHSNVLKIRPPFAFAASDIDRFIAGLDAALRETR
ncbi:aminotransferase class III-fold pyridoxal phosphate-dependent enzyme [Microbacterium sp. SCN 69-37]|nr:aminotransferase class III-fold pyridoxal phosphate-dependent enzyme [Microbacterium sp. SCN 69-37]MBN9223199.1 aminotransferase class III-fold pyridoxal phosphate-dependent enzyme [Microbacterium sp.]ODT25781.1 MAG: 4-aminobutyrate aminotransferase [Microbacterium sp. SCN 69-37]